MNVYIDVETIPSQQDWYRAELAHEAENAEYRAPSNWKDPEKIAAEVKRKKAEALAEVNEQWLKSALDGAYGEIVVICTKTNGHTRAMFQSEDTDERRLLETFCDWVETQLTREGLHRRKPHFIGHNVQFDLKFLWKRLKVHNIQAPFPIPHNATPWSGEYGDTMYRWDSTSKIKLTRLCQVLGVQVADGITGADVWPLWEAGEHEVVIDHCIADVERVVELWRKLS